MKLVILGAGVMGSAMTLPAADNTMDVRLVGTHLDHTVIDHVRKNGFHPKLNVMLPGSVKASYVTEFAGEVGEDTDVILVGVASAGVDWVIEQLAITLRRPIPLLFITKGMVAADLTLHAIPDVVQKALRNRLGFHVPVAAIGGPCIAGELAVRRHTGTVIVSRDADLAIKLCGLLSTEYYHPRTSADMAGVETCAAFKNFFAIAVGWAHGRQEVLVATQNNAKNNNPAAILFDQAIREMMALAQALGGTAASVWGMPGAGDLYVTCQAGRNSRLGNHLGRGATYAAIKAGPMKDETIEGAELGLAVAGAVRAMVAKGQLAAGDVPLTLALLDCLVDDTPLDPPWALFHGGA